MTEPSSQSPWSAPGSGSATGPSGYGPPPGYPAHPGYPPEGYPPPGYGQVPSGYAPPPGYAPPGYGPPPGYPPPGFGPPPGYAPPPPGYGPPPGYPQLAYARLPSGVAVLAPERIDALPGTDFGIAYAAVAPIASGQAVGSMLAGIFSILVAFVELSFGLGGAAAGWGPLISGAFGILALLLGGAAIVNGRFAASAIRRSAGLRHGAGPAKAGTILGFIGVGLAVLSFAGSLLATYAG